MRFCANLLSLMVLGLTACGGADTPGYSFTINDVSVTSAYKSLDVHLRQGLELSEQAREALEHGITLTISLEMELRSDNNMIAVRRDTRLYMLRYLPLNESYQLQDDRSGEKWAFPRLRHLFAALAELDVRLDTGPLPPGSYELRTRIRLDESRLPAPMRLPTWYSAQWQHDSEWSVWPFELNA
ncbi:MAG: DUF4390 domain-containing protein [Xanthomonadales bacterium]|nr:DUF4390 domain-containing protein [Xanthomonadales bacterium]